MAGSSVGSGATISSPAAFFSMSASSSSRYSSWYFSGSNSEASELDELARHLHLAFGGLAGGLGDRAFAIGREHLVGVAHRLEHEHAVDRADRDERLLRPHHEAADRDLALLLHDVDEQAIGLLGALVGDQEVRVLEVHGIDLGEVDEVLDLDLAARLGRERGELVGLHDDVAARLDLVTPDDAVVADLFTRLFRDPPVADPGVGAFLELMEAHVERLRGRDDTHGHGDEAEADGSGPDGAGQGSRS